MLVKAMARCCYAHIPLIKKQLMKKELLLFIAVLLASIASAQKNIRGRVFDAVTKEALQGASVSDSYNHTVMTDAEGKFIITTNAPTITITYNSYAVQTIAIAGRSIVNIALAPSNKDLQQVVVSASRTIQKRSEAPIAISTISKQTLEDTRAIQLDQLLNKVSGVNMVSLGNEQHEMSIRQPMTTKSLFLYLEDGIPIRTTGLYNHNALLEMNIVAARQIEVIKGPASSLYGAEAIGGAVNIITQAPPAVLNGMASIQANNNGYKRVEAQIGNTFGKFGLLVSGYYANRNNGPVDHSNFHKSAITIRGDYRFNDKTKWVNDLTYVDYYSDMLGSLDSIHFLQKDYSTPQTFTYRKVPALRYKSQLYRQWNSKSATQLSVVYRNNSVGQNPSYRVKNAASNPLLAYGEINESAFTTYMAIMQHQQQFTWLGSKLVAGITADASPSNYFSNFINIARDSRGYYINYTTTDSVLSKYKTGITNLASYVNYEFSPAKGLRIIAAARYDYYHYNFKNALPPSAFTGSPSSKNDFSHVSPKVGATYNYKGIGVYVNYSEGFVPPQISELYTGVKVPYLGPQTFFNYEVGGWFSLLKNTLYADWSLYQLDGSNEVVNVKNPDGSTENQNAGKTKHTGIEYGITWRPNIQWMVRFSASNSRHSFVQYIEKGSSYNDKVMPGAPPFLANAEIMYKPAYIKGLRIGAEWQYVDSYYMDNGNTKKYEGYNLLNIRLGYSVGAFEGWVNTMNATNRYYSTYASKAGTTLSYNLGDPRETTLGIAWRFGTK
jgi:outer membrane receptor protein involved in Fe transport